MIKTTFDTVLRLNKKRKDDKNNTKHGFKVAYLIYASLSLSKQVRPICSPLILFLSSSLLGSEGYMERGGPVRQTLA